MSVVKVVLSLFVVLFGHMVSVYQNAVSAEQYFVGDWQITHVEIKYATVAVSEEDLPEAKCVFREDGTGEFLGRPFTWGVGLRFAHMNFGDQTYHARVFDGGRLDILTGPKQEITRYFGVRSKPQEEVVSTTESATPSNTEPTTEPTTTSESQPTTELQPTTERQTKWYDGWSK